MAYILEKIGNTYNLPKKYFTCDAKSDLDGINLVDVPIGSEAYCILEEESYILDSNKQWNKKKIGEDLTGQVQADLSHTDSTQADYVKGVIRQESLPEGYPYKSEEAILDGTFEFADINGMYRHQITDENFTIVDGKSYTVIWDVETYQCVAITVDNGLVVFGNLAIGCNGNDTGEPFIFVDYDGQKVIGTTDTAATHTITVRGEVAYPITSEFLPEGYPYKSGGVVLSETTVQIGTANRPVDLPYTINFMAGSIYKVIWDGIAYEVIAANIEDIIAIGNAALANMGDDTGEPFVIASVVGKTILFAETAGSHTISIIGETIHPMAPEFLPDKYVTETELASKGYLTSETDPTVPAWAKAKTKPSYDFSELTVNNPEAAKTALTIENGMIFKNLQAVMPRSSGWVSVTYGNGKFVAVTQYSNKAAYSKDGITWTETTMPSSAKWNSVTYGNGKFVAVAVNLTTAAYSEDGITWISATLPTLPSSSFWKSVAYGNGKFVAVADVAIGIKIAAYSEDGINWTATTMPRSSGWISVTYGNGKFVAVALNSDKSAYSEDGITWTETTMPSSIPWISVAYGNGKFIAVAENRKEVAYSEDGISWSSEILLNYVYPDSVNYGNGKFIVVASSKSNQAEYSEDGINWNSTILPSSAEWKSVTYGDGKFVAIAYNYDKSAYSEDGITWHDSIQYLSQNNSDITESVRSVIGIPSYSTANNGQFLRVTDGIPTWTESLPTLTSPNGTKYQLTVADDGTLSTVVVS